MNSLPTSFVIYNRQPPQVTPCPRCAYVSADLDRADVNVKRVIDLARNGHAQGTPEWLACREGKITGTSLAVALHGETRFDNEFFMVNNIALSIHNPNQCSRPTLRPISKAMQWGNDHENEALKEFVHASGHVVMEVPFVPVESDPLHLGASPDAITLCGTVVEIKCPYTRMIAKNGKVPPMYQAQVGLEMLATDMADFAFIEYRPRHHKQGYLLKIVNGTFGHLDTLQTAPQLMTQKDWYKLRVKPCVDRIVKDVAVRVAFNRFMSGVSGENMIALCGQCDDE